MAKSFWEEIDGSELAQGDYLLNCPVPIFDKITFEAEDEPLTAVVNVFDLIIVTQTCDLENRKARLVALCPIFTVAIFEHTNPTIAGKWEMVRKGQMEGFHLLSSPDNPNNNREALVVDFREIYSLPFEFLMRHAKAQGSRWRLRSPYLEHFSQAFARFFMRVGLPSQIPTFKK